MKTQLGVCLWFLLTFAAPHTLAQDTRVRQLELDVAQLRRELLAQARRIDELERQTVRGVPGGPIEVKPISPVTSPWLVAANWERIRPGMPESEVLKLLGEPTSVRASDAQRKTLLYALEIAPAAFLAGNVELVEGRVTEITKPVLR